MTRRPYLAPYQRAIVASITQPPAQPMDRKPPKLVDTRPGGETFREWSRRNGFPGVFLAGFPPTGRDAFRDAFLAGQLGTPFAEPIDWGILPTRPLTRFEWKPRRPKLTRRQRLARWAKATWARLRREPIPIELGLHDLKFRWTPPLRDVREGLDPEDRETLEAIDAIMERNLAEIRKASAGGARIELMGLAPNGSPVRPGARPTLMFVDDVSGRLDLS
jgi:hypothetical protein